MLGAVTVLAFFGLIGLSMSDAVPGLARRTLAHLPPAVRRLPFLSFSSGWGLHFVGFSVLTFLAVCSVRRLWVRFGVAGLLMVTGWGIEVAQSRYSAARSYQDVDLLADARGIALGFTAAVCLLTLRSRNRRPAPVVAPVGAETPAS